MWVPDECLKDYDWTHDYRFLKLSFSSDSSTGFGWSGYFDNDEINDIIHLHACGWLPTVRIGDIS